MERLEPVAPFRDPLQELGFIYRADNTERTKRYFREPPGQPRTHIHARKAGSFSEQVPLLFRDFLRVTVKLPPNTRPSNTSSPRVTFWRRSLTAMTSAISRAGFVIDRLEEPTPLPELEEREPATYQRLTTRPGFLLFLLIKRRETGLTVSPGPSTLPP